MFDYYSSFKDQIQQVRNEGRYRDFIGLQRHAGNFPLASWGENKEEVTMWCINDYLGMSQNPKVIDAAQKALLANGVGSGGTRNIGGNNYFRILAHPKVIIDAPHGYFFLVFSPRS